MASASMWMVPIAISFLGRLADYVPKSTMLGIGVFGWGACTLATGSAKSFTALIVTRLLAGLSNCAGYPVAVSLLAEFFSPSELTTAMGYFNAGFGIGGLLGMALGGTLITQLGWRWAFWGVASPQLVLSILLVATVREKHQPPPRQSWARDFCQLLRMPAIRFLMASALLSGLMTGNHRFISALAERLFHVTAQKVGLVLGFALGLTGIVAGPVSGHLVGFFHQRLRDDRVLLWCAAGGDVLHLILGTCALLSPSFGLFVLLLALAACVGSLGQGVDTAIQMLAAGRRGTTQSLVEGSWAIGMAVGPFLGGLLSDSLLQGSCDSGCALARSLMVIAGIGLCLRSFCGFMAGVYFMGDLKKVGSQGASSKPQCSPESAGSMNKDPEPQPTTMGRRSTAHEELA